MKNIILYTLALLFCAFSYLSILIIYDKESDAEFRRWGAQLLLQSLIGLSISVGFFYTDAKKTK